MGQGTIVRIATLDDVNLQDEGITLREALARFLLANDLGDGGYDARWVDLGARPVPMVFPNTAGYARAMRIHDLHHVLTGYATNPRGEYEIASWELGSGCAGHLAAWAFNVLGLGLGGLRWPRATLAAFRAGRASRNLFAERYDDHLLDQRVGETRRRLGLPVALGSPATGDYARFGATFLAGFTLAVLFLCAVAPVLAVTATLVAKRRSR